MKSKTLWDQPLGMLMASGSPGSALAYDLGQAVFEPEMAQRTIPKEAPADRPNPALAPSATNKTQTKSNASCVPSVRGWLGRVLDRLEAWSWERDMREREAYLAQAQDLYDLEARMRHLDGDEFSRRGRALR